MIVGHVDKVHDVPFGTLDEELLKKMAEAAGIEDVIPLFEATPYSALAQMLPAYEQAESLLPLESMLDKVLLENMWACVEVGGPLQVLQSFFAARIDAINMKILMRAKRDHLLLIGLNRPHKKNAFNLQMLRFSHAHDSSFTIFLG